MTTGKPSTPIPGRSDEGDFVYVIQFSSGTIKVGRTQNPSSRLKSHAAVARAHGLTVAAQWVSQPITTARQSERRLIGFCNDRFTPLNDGEFFSGATIDEVLHFGATLDGGAGSLILTQVALTDSRNGRPSIGSKVEVRIPEEILARVDAFKGDRERADALRDIIAAGLDALSPDTEEA